MTESIDVTDAKQAVEALRYALEFASVKHSTHATALRQLADSIEGQVKPAIEEPKEFGSMVKATTTKPSTIGTAGLFWVKIQGAWTDDGAGVSRRWEDLDVIEVLRIRVGEARLPSIEDLTDMSKRAWEAKRPEQTPTYQQGFDDCALHLRKQLIQLRSSAITAERQDAFGKAIEAVEALS